MTAENKTRPILFSTEMVKTILDGHKTQTRRIIKPQPDNREYFEISKGHFVPLEKILRYCPYGQVGDRLWVRETFVIESDEEYQDESFYHLVTDRPIKTIPAEGEYGSYHLIPHYRATEPEPNIVTKEQDDEFTRWTPSIFMPRWASRITLEITDIRVQQLRGISESDALAEGVPALSMMQPAVMMYQRLWDTINPKTDWMTNPFVWAITFKLAKLRKGEMA